MNMIDSLTAKVIQNFGIKAAINTKKGAFRGADYLIIF